IRASVPKLNLDSTFDQKNDITRSMESKLEEAMSLYGYEIVQTLIIDIEPSEHVKKAMNEINAVFIRHRLGAEVDVASQIREGLLQAKCERFYLSHFVFVEFLVVSVEDTNHRTEGSDHFDVFALKTDGDDHNNYESDNREEPSLEELYSQLVSQLEKLMNEKQSLSGQLKTCEQNRLITVEKVKLGEIEIEKLRLELTSTQQKLEVFYHRAKNIDKILSMSKNGSDKRGLGFDEQNVKSTSSQVTKFVKATSTPFLPKPSIIDAPHMQTEQPFVFHIFYCEACGRKGHLAPYCRYVPQLRGRNNLRLEREKPHRLCPIVC
ncbi:hypothetical protein GIB67_033025, partial [Kingdonia uniflora]